jgi:ureidoglycolate lyase
MSAADAAMRIDLRALPLTAEAFAPFGDVIETGAREFRWINEGTCKRYDDLARIDVAAEGGRPLISVFEANPRPLPFRVRILERHPLSSQAFFPLEARPFLVVVAAEGAAPQAGGIRAFWSSGRQGVNYRRNTWHHALIALGETSRFLVVDRGGAGVNCDEAELSDAIVHVGAP